MREKIQVLQELLLHIPLIKRKAYLKNLGPIYEEIVNAPNLFIDPRDYNIYFTTQIGQQVWMADNLRYHPKQNLYNNHLNPNLFFGYLYTWQQAITFCPKGWRLPNREDWLKLECALGLSNEENHYFHQLHHPRARAQGRMLKASNYWKDEQNGNNISGFHALPAGYFWNQQYYELNENALFWTSSTYDSSGSWYKKITLNHDVHSSVCQNHLALSCRYIKSHL